MNEPDPSAEQIKDRFLHARHSYQGEITLGNLAFDANLQEFASRVAIICALETSGKIPPLEAYNQIKSLWQQFAASAENLINTE
ncbi:MAG: hypothetical protein HC919_04195 [Oscillatoriales cyanobacterium SM2_2_1]|nr:hypothetical protein [Oscillatoriales cyanobacterium SM2_2_1]